VQFLPVAWNFQFNPSIVSMTIKRHDSGLEVIRPGLLIGRHVAKIRDESQEVTRLGMPNGDHHRGHTWYSLDKTQRALQNGRLPAFFLQGSSALRKNIHQNDKRKIRGPPAFFFCRSSSF
jgi:hypothetical protein